MKKFAFLVYPVVAVMASGAILFTQNGGISWDSTYYLRLAEYIKGGNLMAGVNYDQPGESVLFAIWPLMYGALIGSISFLTQVPVYYAVHILHLMLLLIAILIIRDIFQDNSLYVFPFLFLAPFLSLFQSVLSEWLFLCIVLFWMWSLIKYYNGRKNRYLVFLGLALVLLVLTRYVGIIFFVPSAILIFYDINRRVRRFNLLMFIAIGMAGTIVTFYLLINRYFTGFITGYARGDQFKEPLEVVANIAYSLLSQISFIWLPL